MEHKLTLKPEYHLNALEIDQPATVSIIKQQENNKNTTYSTKNVENSETHYKIQFEDEFPTL